MPRKIRDYKTELIRLGFVQRRGKGSHQNWKHPQLQLLITIAFKDGEDTPLYLEKLLKQAIQELETIAAEESEE
ncbi:MAG: type II toxin-antitoxin system HicA family toxin [Oscillatoriaceae cyanobacterium Prado104]|jgi:predicted RNA binding protein YcfA (HicA-like mRNA interferase family)|nr:type II toxin-antitoxin system HicA family toxin [Oscillatoriaceae cyanobacterium Prado104]